MLGMGRSQDPAQALERTKGAAVCRVMVILIVEDEYLISELLRTILETGGHRVIAAFDADEAISVLEESAKSSL
jgi:PleD family two-component response regulator